MSDHSINPGPSSASAQGEGEVEGQGPDDHHPLSTTDLRPPLPIRRQSQLSDIAKAAINTRAATMAGAGGLPIPTHPHPPRTPLAPSALANITNIDSNEFEIPKPAFRTLLTPPTPTVLSGTLQAANMAGGHAFLDGVGHPLSDTPMGSAPSTAPSSPRLPPVRQDSGHSTPRTRPPATTLNIPGMTKSRVSPDGKIAQRDVGAKLVVVMVGLPARGKSYITKKIHRYLSWQQHETRIFNVGARRRVAAATTGSGSLPSVPSSPEKPPGRSPSVNVIRTSSIQGVIDRPTLAAHMILNGVEPSVQEDEPIELPNAETMEQSAEFFNPKNEKASAIREQVALSTLDELLDFLLDQGGSVGILDATNSTIARRQIIFNHIKEREPKLGILFIESVCEDQKLLETNMRLKLRGPDYKDKDPESSYEDFKKRVAAYESAYVPIGTYEEDNKMQYIKMIDVGRKMINHQLSGFLTGGIASYLSTFNLSPRQIWITRHGKSMDNCLGKIGGDSPLTEGGRHYGTALYNFITTNRMVWERDQKRNALKSTALPPKAGDTTPPYPDLLGDLEEKNFCVWTSMLKRSIDTAHVFDDDEDYDVKNWDMLNELNAGIFEGKTYAEIAEQFPEEYAKRRRDKLHYIYPGVGGEGYLQVISRLRDMVREIERIKDHVLIIGHRSVCRVLMAYFMDLTRDDIADLDVPLGMLYSIEPKPYGIDFHAYKYNEENYWFDELPGYRPQRETEKSA